MFSENIQSSVLVRDITKEGKEVLRRLGSSSDTTVNRESRKLAFIPVRILDGWCTATEAKLEHGTGAIRKANLYDPNTVSPSRFDPLPGVAGKVSNWPWPAGGDEPQATVAHAGAIHIK